MSQPMTGLDERRILALLDRLDPEPLTPCGVAGCRHFFDGNHVVAVAEEALAA